MRMHFGGALIPSRRSAAGTDHPVPRAVAKRTWSDALGPWTRVGRGRRERPRGGVPTKARSSNPRRVTHLRREPGPDRRTLHLGGIAVNECAIANCASASRGSGRPMRRSASGSPARAAFRSALASRRARRRSILPSISISLLWLPAARSARGRSIGLARLILNRGGPGALPADRVRPRARPRRYLTHRLRSNLRFPVGSIQTAPYSCGSAWAGRRQRERRGADSDHPSTPRSPPEIEELLPLQQSRKVSRDLLLPPLSSMSCARTSSRRRTIRSFVAGSALRVAIITPFLSADRSLPPVGRRPRAADELSAVSAHAAPSALASATVTATGDTPS
jgi:hypothetical protein